MMTSISEDKDELNEYENHCCISTLKIPKNLFALPKLQKTVRIINYLFAYTYMFSSVASQNCGLKAQIHTYFKRKICGPL